MVISTQQFGGFNFQWLALFGWRGHNIPQQVAVTCSCFHPRDKDGVFSSVTLFIVACHEASKQVTEVIFMFGDFFSLPSQSHTKEACQSWIGSRKKKLRNLHKCSSPPTVPISCNQCSPSASFFNPLLDWTNFASSAPWAEFSRRDPGCAWRQ